MPNKPVGYSYLNTPINSSVIFSAPQPDYLLPGYDFADNGFIILNDVLVTVRQSKNIVKTQLVRPQGTTSSPSDSYRFEKNFGYAGTVKEYISLGDYQIDLRGYLTAEEIDDYPQEKLERLREYLSYPGSFRISGKFINLFDFTEVIVLVAALSEAEGFSTQIPFTISLLSDNFLEVKYTPAETSGYVGVDLVGPSNTTA